MKRLIALLISILVLAPAAALAEQGPIRDAGAPQPRAGVSVDARAGASSTQGRLPALGPAIRAVASTTRALSSSTIEMVKARVDAIRQAIAKKRQDIQKRADDAREKARERFGEKVGNLVGDVSGRLASSSASLDGIADRISGRIDALEDQGRGMDASIDLLATARADISAANDKILAVNAALEDAMSTTTPKAAIPAVRGAVKAAEDALSLAKQDLQKTLVSIKAESAATTTVGD